MLVFQLKIKWISEYSNLFESRGVQARKCLCHFLIIEILLLKNDRRSKMERLHRDLFFRRGIERRLDPSSWLVRKLGE